MTLNQPAPAALSHAEVDPVAAHRLALRDGMVVNRADPLTCETSVPALIGGVVMPNAHLYVRNHFRMPAIDTGSWSLEVTGLVERRLTLSLSDLDRLPSETRVFTLECAGNGRRFLTPAVDGEPWGLGAVSTAEWTGVPLGVPTLVRGAIELAGPGHVGIDVARAFWRPETALRVAHDSCSNASRLYDQLSRKVATPAKVRPSVTQGGG